MFPGAGESLYRGESLYKVINAILPDFLIGKFSHIALKESGSPEHPFYRALFLKVCVKFIIEFLLAAVFLGFSVYDFINGAYISAFMETVVSAFLFVNTPILAKRFSLEVSNNLSLTVIGLLLLIVTFEVLPKDALVVSGALLFPVLAFIYKGKGGVYWSVEFAVLHVLIILLSVTYHMPQSAIVNNELWFKGSVPDLAYIIGSVYLIYFLLLIVLFAHYVIIETYSFTWERVSSTDRLTGALNRVAFDRAYHKEIARVRRYASPLALIIFDIDDFKCINDTFGHHAGDSVLREVATLVSSNIRETDYFVRWGGEEFLILCPNTDIDSALYLSEKLRRAISLHRFPIDRGVTASFGVSELLPEDTADTFIDRADKALYRAKLTGKNRVCLADSELASGKRCDTF